MGSNSKKYKEKTDRRKRHRSRSSSEEHDAPKEKRHRHKKHHHKDRRRDRQSRRSDSESRDSDVVEVTSDKERTPTPPNNEATTNAQSHDNLSIDETNKLRAKLGLKPLQVGSEAASSSKSNDGKKKDDLGEFYHKPAGNLAEKERSEKLKKKLSDHKEKRMIENKLSKVRLLGDSESDDDVSSWVDKNRKITDAKKEAEQRAKMLEELDEQFGVGELIEQERRERQRKKYTEQHLKGLEVQHNVDNFDEGKTVVLTLKDKNILDEDESDVLVNINMLDDERYKKSNENKKKVTYNPYDIEEFDEFGNPKEKDLLEKYNEEIDGVKKDSFQIGYDNNVQRKKMISEYVKQKLSNKRIEQLDTTKLTLASEYYNEEEMAKFKKPKKKVRKLREKVKADLDDIKQAEEEQKISRKSMVIDDDDDTFTDKRMEEKDDTLERALNKARRLKQRDAVATDLINRVVEHIKPEVKIETEVDAGNIILNSTAEFCRTLGDIPTYGKSGNREETEDLIDFDAEDQEEHSDDDCQIVEPSGGGGGGWSSIDPNSREMQEMHLPVEVPILDEEPDVSTGVGAALKLASSKGYLDKEEVNRPSNSRLTYLQAKHYSIEDKNYGEDMERGGGGGGGGRRERYTGPTTDFKEKDGFKPNVKLEYIDDEGHVLNSKEAFRYLSHKFHGKGPGKNKIEKRLKKAQQEGLMKKMSSTDTPLGTLHMLQNKQKEMQSPYIVLSGGKTHSTSISKTRR